MTLAILLSADHNYTKLISII